MRKKYLWFFFSLSTFLTLISPSFLFHFRMHPYASFLAYIMFRNNTKTTLSFSFLCGLMLDLFSTEFPFGILCLIYIFSTGIIFFKKFLLIYKETLFIPIYTFFISLAISALFWISKSIMGFSNNLTFPIFFREGLLMSLVDTLFALIVYSLPIKTVLILRKKGFNFNFLTKLH